MAEQQELRVVLRTEAQGAGAQQTSAALRQIARDANQVNQSNLGRTFALSGESALRFAGALTGVNIGLSLAAELGQQLKNVLSADTFIAAERTARATAASYGQLAGQFQRFASALSAETGFGQREILEAAVSARTLSTNYGLAIQQTQQLIRVSADLATIRGIGVEQAFERVQSAIRGEAEASEFLGLTLNDTFIKNNALNGSVKTTFERMTDAQKAQVRYTELLRQTATFTGLAAQGQEGLEGAQRRASLASEDFARTLGQILAPTLLDAARGQEALTRATTEYLRTLNEGTGNERQARVMQQNREEISKSLEQIGLSTNRFGFVIDKASGQILNVEQVADRLKVTWDELLAVMGQDDPAIAARFSGAAEGIDLVTRAVNRQTAAQSADTRQADQARAERQSRRLREINENLPTQTQAQALAELAFLDQRDAAVRDVVRAQREGLAIQTEMNRLRGEEANATLGVLAERQEVARLEREIANQVNRRLQLQLEARRIAAEQRAAPAQGALQDTERQIERARLVTADLSQAPEDRSAAIREAIQLQLRVAPQQRLEAFDAQTAVINVEREQRAEDLATRARQNPIEQRQAVLQEGSRGREDAILSIQQAMERQETLAKVAAARTDEANVRLGQIIQQGIADGFAKQKQPMQLTVQVLDSGGNVTYEEILEAEDQASFPPVVQVSGVRRRP